MKTENVIIVANGINGLGAVRSASKAGLKVFVILASDKDLAAYSRYSENKLLLPKNPKKDDLLCLLKGVHDDFGRASIICCSDLAAEWVSELSKEISKIHFMIDISPSIVTRLNDKRLECEAMASGGVRIPTTTLDLTNEQPLSFPLLIKPRMYLDYSVLGAKNLVINSIEEFSQFKQDYCKALDRFIAQEIITGGDENLWVCNVTFDNESKLINFFSFQRLGTMPSHYGVTSMALSQFNEELLEECRKIGAAINYIGPAMIEFKFCTQRKKYYYIETNPRIGMCNWFDSRCGVNNILCSHLVAQGLSPDRELPRQKDNRLFLNLMGDLMARVENRERPIGVFKLYLSHVFKNKVGATVYWKDPLPGIIYSSQVTKAFFSRIYLYFFKRS